MRLAKAGHLMERGYGERQVARPFNPGTIKAMLEGPAPAAGDALGRRFQFRVGPPRQPETERASEAMMLMPLSFSMRCPVPQS